RPPPPRSPPFPYAPLVRADMADGFAARQRFLVKAAPLIATPVRHANLQRVWLQLMDLRERYGVPKASMLVCALLSASAARPAMRSEEHTSELQSREKLVCR